MEPSPKEGTPEELAGAAMSHVLRRLNSAPRTRHELAQSCREKGFPLEIYEAVLDRVEEMGYINDADFANNWVRSRTRSRGLAPSVLRRELTLKGVDRDLIDAALEEIDPKDSDRRARELAEKKMRSLLGVSTQVAIRRIASQLQRKGYPPGMSLAIARDVAGSSGDAHDFHELDH